MKKASLSQDAIERVKIQATDVRKYLKFMYLIKNLYSGVYEYIKTTDQEENIENLIQIWTKDLIRYFIKEDVHLTSKHRNGSQLPWLTGIC